MHIPDKQHHQEQRSWVRPQLSELDINIQTQGGIVEKFTESTWQHHSLPFDDKNTGS